jgi:hypothetical protein
MDEAPSLISPKASFRHDTVAESRSSSAAWMRKAGGSVDASDDGSPDHSSTISVDPNRSVRSRSNGSSTSFMSLATSLAPSGLSSGEPRRPRR